MGVFVKVLGAMVIADAIDRSARRPTRYWYPNQPGLPRPGWYGDPARQALWRWWDGQQWSSHTHP